MGKNEDEQALSTFPSSISSENSEINGGVHCGRCRWISRIVSLRCVMALIVGVAVFLSAAFWLLPVFGNGKRDLDPDPQFRGAYVVASFRVQKPVSLLNTNIAKLQYDIYDEIGIPDTSVAVISLEPLGVSNWTNVVFGIWRYPHKTISSTWLSIMRENFINLVTQQSTLHLTTSLFGSSYFFQVLKFPGGITVIPQQSVFLLQRAHVLFNFTLNFPIYKVQNEFNELKAQMKSGLLLTSDENLYVRLTNLKGSTIDSPTVVQTSIVLKVGNKQPSVLRLRQLAQTIRSSSSGNLGLNHSVFGRVKEIQLSSFLKYSLNGSISPSPAPQPHVHHHHHHHHHHRRRRHHHHHHDHHHHRHHHHSDLNLAPATSPQNTYKYPSPSRCHSVSPKKSKSNAFFVPAAAPVDSTQSSPAPSSTEDPPMRSPVEDPLAPARHLSRRLLPYVVLTHARPPSESGTYIMSRDEGPSISPSSFSSSVAGQPFAAHWILVTLLYLIRHL